MLANVGIFHHPLARTAGSAYGYECLVLSGRKSQHFFHISLAEGHQAQIAVERGIGERMLPGSGIDAYERGVRGKHNKNANQENRDDGKFIIYPMMEIVCAA